MQKDTELGWKYTKLAWLVFFGGFAVEMAVLYALGAILPPEIFKGGRLSELVWFAIQWVLAIVSVRFAYLGTAPLKKLWKRLLVLGLEVAVAFCIYAIVGLIYVVFTGIDSM